MAPAVPASLNVAPSCWLGGCVQYSGSNASGTISLTRRFDQEPSAFFRVIDQRFEKIDVRFEKVDQRFEQVHRDVSSLETRMERRFADLFKWSFVFWCGAVGAALWLAGCAVTDVGRAPALPAGESLAVLPIVNYTETPQAGLRA